MRRSAVYAWAFVGGLAVACSAEFPNEPDATLTIALEPGAVTTLMVRDISNLTVDIGDSRGETITGIQVDWQSSDPAKLELQRVPPPQTNPTEEDMLAAELTVRAIAHARGKAEVKVTIDRPGFHRTEMKDTITVLEHWKRVSAGTRHSCGITIDGLLLCWGYGGTGALGDGSASGSTKPVQVIGVTDLKFAVFTVGNDNTCGAVLQGLLNCWGTGADGRLGIGSELDQFIPATVALGGLVSSVSSGVTTCSITSTDLAYCWGNDRFGQLGSPKSPFFPLDSCSGQPCSLLPRAVRRVADTLRFGSVDVGLTHVCGIAKLPTADRLAFCWGTGGFTANNDTIYMLGDSIFQSDTAVPVAGSLRFSAITAGGQHTCGIAVGGSTYCWGAGNRGQLGGGTLSDQAKPQVVSGPVTFQSLTAGDAYTCGIASDDRAYCWGANDYGQLGIGSTTSTSVPTVVSGGLVFQHISAGEAHTCGVTTRGAVYCWGRNDEHQLGSALSTDMCNVAPLVKPCGLVPYRVDEP